MPARQHKKKRREARLRRERHRAGTPRRGHGWAARQAAHHSAGGRSVSQRKVHRFSAA